MKNKTGIAYNIFQGTELLPYSIKQIRNQVDIVVGCIQLRSWTGQPIQDKDLIIIDNLKKEGLIDKIIYFTPDTSQAPKHSQTVKSEFCRLYLKNQGCDYFLISDVDEIYHEHEFKKAKETFIQSGLGSSCCLMETYYKEPTYQLNPRVQFFVPFMYRMDQRQYHLSNVFPVKVDNSRKLSTTVEQLMVFKPEQLLMHHYSYIRNDLKEKTDNSTNKKAYPKEFNNLVTHFNKWKFPDQAMIGVNQHFNVIEVDNYFGIST
jgi:hypothetical protein